MHVVRPYSWDLHFEVLTLWNHPFGTVAATRLLVVPAQWPVPVSRALSMLFVLPFLRRNSSYSSVHPVQHIGGQQCGFSLLGPDGWLGEHWHACSGCLDCGRDSIMLIKASTCTLSCCMDLLWCLRSATSSFLIQSLLLWLSSSCTLWACVGLGWVIGSNLRWLSRSSLVIFITCLSVTYQTFCCQKRGVSTPCEYGCAPGKRCVRIHLALSLHHILCLCLLLLTWTELSFSALSSHRETVAVSIVHFVEHTSFWNTLVLFLAPKWLWKNALNSAIVKSSLIMCNSPL